MAETTTARLEAAYRATAYRVDDGPVSLVIRVGEHIEGLDALLDQLGATSWAYLTAWNPRSRRRSLDANRTANENLRARLGRYTVFSGEGVGANSDWREQSLLVVGIEEEHAHGLAREFEQTAFVCGHRGSAARLVFTKLDDSGEDHDEA